MSVKRDFQLGPSRGQVAETEAPAARALGVNVSAVADEAIQRAVTEARQRRWLDENADAFAAQAEWHERNGHPLADILAAPGKASWNA